MCAGVTATAEGRLLLLGLPELLKQLVVLMQDSSVPVGKDAALALVNITGDEAGISAMLIISQESNSSNTNEQNLSFNLIHVCIRFVICIYFVLYYFAQLILNWLFCYRAIMDKTSTLADPCCMILSNITRSSYSVESVITHIERSGYTWDAIIAAFTAKQYNTVGAKLHYLGAVFSNLSQSPRVRRYLFDLTLDFWILFDCRFYFANSDF